MHAQVLSPRGLVASGRANVKTRDDLPVISFATSVAGLHSSVKTHWPGGTTAELGLEFGPRVLRAWDAASFEVVTCPLRLPQAPMTRTVRAREVSNRVSLPPFVVLLQCDLTGHHV